MTTRLTIWLAVTLIQFLFYNDNVTHSSAQPTVDGSTPHPVGEGIVTPVVVRDLFLVDAVTGQDFERMFSGMTIDIQSLNTTAITVRAELDWGSLISDAPTGIKTIAVMFDLDDGILQRIESTTLVDTNPTYNSYFYLAGKDDVSNKPFPANSLLPSSSLTNTMGTKIHTVSVKAICTTSSVNSPSENPGLSIIDEIQMQPNGDQQLIGTNPRSDEINNITEANAAASFSTKDAISGQDIRRRNTETSNNGLNTTASSTPDGSLTVTFSVVHTRSSEAPVNPVPTVAPTPRATTSPIQTSPSPLSTTQSPSFVGGEDKTKYDVRGYKVHPNGYLNFDGNDTIYVYDKVTIAFEGPFASETGTTDRDNDYYRRSSTFADYRLDVHFYLVTDEHHTDENSYLSQHHYVVPGYFTAYGHVANAGSPTGNAWLCHFRPNHAGIWNWTTSFTRGMNVAQQTIFVHPNIFGHQNHITDMSSTTANSTFTSAFGDSAGFMDGSTGSFLVTVPAQSTDESSEETISIHKQAGSGKLGRMIHPPGTNRYELVRSGSSNDSATEHTPYIKIGTGDTPIDLLSYESNWNSDTMPSKHIVDYIEGNPTWASGQGKNTMGAINYLAKNGVNTVTVSTISSTFHPFATNNQSIVDGTATDIDYHHVLMSYNVTKLAQCEIIVSWIETRGLSLNVVLGDTKVQFLDVGSDGTNGALYDSRRLYFREMIARFSHHSAVTWYLDGDATSSIDEILQRAKYIRSVDPYKHPIVVRVNPAEEMTFLKELVSNTDVVDGISIQSILYEMTDSTIKDILAIKETIGNELSRSAIIESEALVTRGPDDIATIRQNVLWSSLLGGSIAGIMYKNYFYGQDFTDHQPLWEQSYYAISKFFQYTDPKTNSAIPYYSMSNANQIVSEGSWCTINDSGTTLVVYKNAAVASTPVTVRFAEIPSVLQGFVPGRNNSAMTYSIQWFDPVAGEMLTNGTVREVSPFSTNSNPYSTSIGSPPYATTNQDWVVLIQCTNSCI